MKERRGREENGDSKSCKPKQPYNQKQGQPVKHDLIKASRKTDQHAESICLPHHCYLFGFKTFRTSRYTMLLELIVGRAWIENISNLE